jgi:SAM-dependent methyltransferase
MAAAREATCGPPVISLPVAGGQRSKPYLDRKVERYAQAHPQLGSGAALSPLLVNLVESLSPTDVVVDLGCGEGRTLRGVKMTANAGFVAGIELSFLRASVANAEGIPTLVADGLALPIRGGSVDLVICRHVIEHVSDDALLLREISRVLVNGGVLYLETPLKLPGAWYLYRNESGERVLDPTHVREYRSVHPVIDLLRSEAFLPTHQGLRPILFPVPHLIYHVLRTLGLSRRTPSWLPDWPTLRVPRYREIQVVARKMPRRSGVLTRGKASRAFRHREGEPSP